ncbi:MAG: glycoside hydrolase family 127 protein [Paraprevotella sp.]|nr:glycoside hydrolase family 127 protein [Paraprevotella sp.]
MKHNPLTATLIGACFCCIPTAMQGQSKLYPRLFDLQEVSLNEGIFKQAMELNDKVLLEYDTDRLLTPYFRQAGFTEWEKLHPNFPNWGSGNFRLDGHIGGHYLSALALAYAASKDEDTRAQLKERMDYMVDRMDECQRAFDHNTEGLYGYIGGLPDNWVWTGLYKGDLTAYNRNRGNVPFYVVHKIYAGLRDAWVYGGNEKAKACFLKLCDWGVNLIAHLDDATLQNILDTEHGGINEVYADAYQMTGDEKYLTAAKRYSHATMVANMQTVNSTFLDNKHANTQVPKYIGFARIAQKDDRDDASSIQSYRKTAHNFWTEVVDHRTVAIGGNSVSEHFLPASRSSEYITNPDGPESCNTNNMLKLTEDLFADEQEAKYADFYEQALLNHNLSTQTPNTGGFVYFTSLRPQHYHVYSQVNQGMWCCVGTGMENHSKYGEFVYAHSPGNDTLFVNLFVASRLKDKNFALTQQTGFPYEEKTTLTVDQGGRYVLAVRHPQWCKGAYKIKVNGVEYSSDTSAPGSYAYLNRTWKSGDRIEVDLPRAMEIRPCPNYDRYVAFRYGPVLLGASTGTENLVGQFAGEGRMDHAPSQGAQLSLTSAPMLIGQREDVLKNIEIVDKKSLRFKFKPGIYNSPRFADLVLQPFYTLQECRYMVYWNQLTQAEWTAVKDEVTAEEQAAQELQNRTLDFVTTGEQQSDAGHVLQGEFEKGSYAGEFYVDALPGKEFSYVLSTQNVSRDVSLMCRYHSADAGRRYTI